MAVSAIVKPRGVARFSEMKSPLPSLLAGTSFLILAVVPGLHAVPIYSENFTGLTSLPAAFATTGTDVSFGVSPTQGNGAPSLSLLDASTSGSGSALVNGTNWAAFDTSTGPSTFRTSFDWRVDSSSSAIGGAATTRFTLRLDSGASTASAITIGFGHATVSSTDTNFFYAQGASAAPLPSSSNAIGLLGGAFASGFNFGAYDGTTAANNNTGGTFYRFTVDYEDNASSALINVFNVSNPSQATNFTVSGLTPTSVANTVGRSIGFVAGSSGTGTSYFDNIAISAVPEPATAPVIILGLAALLMARRFHSSSSRRAAARV